MNLNRFKRQLLSRIYLTRALIVVGLLVFLVCMLFLIFRLTSGGLAYTGSPLPQTGGRTNIVFLGIGGPGHDGPDLTDSIIFISIKSATGEVVLISVPRDIWVPSLKAKINTAYTYGQQRDPGKGGLVLAKSSVSEILNQPVHLAVVLDFSTFQQAVDLIGGIDVVVDHSFSDAHYPILGKENDPCNGDKDFACRYETISFTPGQHHFDGATALKFVRSRYALGEEGSDFARGRRQEKVITAFTNKLTSWSIIRRLHLYSDLYHLLVSNVVTDIKPGQYFSLAKLGLKVHNHKFKTFSLSEPDQLYNPPLSDQYDNQWLLLPKDNNPQIIYSYVQNLLK